MLELSSGDEVRATGPGRAGWAGWWPAGISPLPRREPGLVGAGRHGSAGRLLL